MKAQTHLASLVDPSVLERLTGACPAPKLPRAKDFVRAYSDAIRAARENGWTIDQIHNELQCAGVQIALRTLRKYVNDVCGPVRKRREPQNVPRSDALFRAAAATVVPTQPALAAKPRSLRRSAAGKA